jgi:hypothetical protein
VEQLDKLKQEYNGFRQKALALTEKTQAEDRSLTDAEMAAIEEHVKAAKGLRPEIERMERGLRVMELVGRASDHHFGVKDGDPRAEGRRAAASVGDRDHQAGGDAGRQGVQRSELSIPLPALSTVPFPLGQLDAPLIRAIGLRPWPAVGGRAVTYLRQTGRTNRAASLRRR